MGNGLILIAGFLAFDLNSDAVKQQHSGLWIHMRIYVCMVLSSGFPDWLAAGATFSGILH